MYWLSESLWHASQFLGDSELKYGGHSKNWVNFLGKMMMSWRVELTCGAETLWEVPIQRGIFQGDALSWLLFVIALIPLTHILRTANPGYEFRTGETINHLLLINNHKLYSKNKRVMDSLIHTACPLPSRSSWGRWGGRGGVKSLEKYCWEGQKFLFWWGLHCWGE